jgi:hypothetical protein
MVAQAFMPVQEAGDSSVAFALKLLEMLTDEEIIEYAESRGFEWVPLTAEV